MSAVCGVIVTKADGMRRDVRHSSLPEHSLLAVSSRRSKLSVIVSRYFLVSCLSAGQYRR
jgi:hypothetical protein